jgi:hypothetical protein
MGMATKRSNLPPIISEDLQAQAEHLRPTPNGGYAWKCHYCGEFASSETQKGLYVCRRHGGATSRQRKKGSRPPGRPITSGKHSRSKMLRVDEIVEEFRQKLIDVDATDEDLLYLRGHLARAIGERPNEEDVAVSLEELEQASFELHEALNRVDTSSRESLLRALAEVRLYRKVLKRVTNYYQRFMRMTGEIEQRYARFIKLARLRSTINHKNAPAEQLSFFAATVRLCLQVLANHLTPEWLALVRARVEKEFAELPDRALTLTALKPATLTLEAQSNFYRVNEQNDPLDEIVDQLRRQKIDLDDTDEDMLRLRAHLRGLRQLSQTISTTAARLGTTLEALDLFMESDGVENAVRERLDWEKIERLHGELSRFNQVLEGFDQGLEARHERIILLTHTRQLQRLQEAATDQISLYQLRLERFRHLLLDIVDVEDYQAMEVQMLEAITAGNHESSVL